MPKTRSVLLSALALSLFLSTNSRADSDVGTPDPATMEEVFHYLERSTYSQTVQDFQPDALDMFLLISGDIIHADIDERGKSFLLPNVVSFLENPSPESFGVILKYAAHPRINHTIDPAVVAAATVYYVQKQAEIGNTVEITMQRVAERQAMIEQLERNIERHRSERVRLNARLAASKAELAASKAEGERLEASLAKLDTLIQATQQTIDMVRGM